MIAVCPCTPIPCGSWARSGHPSSPVHLHACTAHTHTRPPSLSLVLSSFVLLLSPRLRPNAMPAEAKAARVPHYPFLYAALLLVVTAFTLGIVACVLTLWVVQEDISDEQIAEGAIKQWQAVLSDAYISALQNYTAQNPGAVTASQRVGLWQVCTEVKNATVVDPGCSSLYYGHLPDCERDIRIGLGMAGGFVICGIIFSSFAVCCCCMALVVPKMKMFTSCQAFAAFACFVIALLVYHSSARKMYCGDPTTRLLCGTCGWGAAFWLCLAAFLAAFVGGLALCVAPLPPRIKHPPRGDPVEEGPGDVEEDAEDLMLALRNLEDEETHSTGHQHPGPTATQGRYWIKRQEEDEWCQLLRQRMAARPTPNLGVEIKMVEDGHGICCVLQVHTVFPDGPAHTAGLAAGDVIAKGNGQVLDSKDKFRYLLYGAKPGEPVVLDVYRTNPDGVMELHQIHLYLAPGGNRPPDERLRVVSPGESDLEDPVPV